MLLDEAFAGIDDEARASCMGLIREFDLDFVMTSEREWGCYAEIPGLNICQLVRREDMDAIFVSRWSWDGRERREEADPVRRFPEAAVAERMSRDSIDEERLRKLLGGSNSRICACGCAPDMREARRATNSP